MQHRVSFACEQCVHVYAALGGQLFETAALELMRLEYFALFVREFVERSFQFIEQETPDVSRFRPSVRGGKQVCEIGEFAFFVDCGKVAEVLRFLLAEQVRDPIASDAKQPSRDMLDRHE